MRNEKLISAALSGDYVSVARLLEDVALIAGSGWFNMGIHLGAARDHHLVVETFLIKGIDASS